MNAALSITPMLFPLRLTPFEEYMLADNLPAYPMCCFIKVKLQGTFNADVFESAIRKTLEYHPLLTGSVTENSGKYYWEKANTAPTISRAPLDESRPFPPSKGIDLFNEPALKITICNADTATVALDGRTEIVFEIHHSASDAVGLLRFIEDTLCQYARTVGFVPETGSQPPGGCAEPSLLVRRGLPGRRHRSILQILTKQLHGLRRAWKFLMYRVAPLTAKKPADLQKLCEDYPAVLFRELSEPQTQSAVRKAKELGITLNELFLCSAFFAMKSWQNLPHGRNLRIAVPINLRTAADELMPAANIVSMVFLDRKPKDIQPVQAFYDGIHREMSHIKRYNLGWAMIRGLTVYRRLFGNYRKMMHPDRCWTTATVSNLGRVFTDTPLPKREGNVLVDHSLELLGVEAFPPVRSSTALGICLMTYAGRLTVNLHYDAAVLTQADAERILDTLVSHCDAHCR
ncbi:MAG: hypothetical protein FWG73_04015 [Planctomycetaceae bacterium]|nr:hypothetical protein [Planctomycetaceae bacterium]